MKQHATSEPELGARNAFGLDLAADHLLALWEHLQAAVPAEPSAQASFHSWSFETVKRHLMRAGELISAQEAERRVLVLKNPSVGQQLRITDTLYAGIQLILPGEAAPLHRHSQSALRFVLEGKGATTTVDGEPTMMHPGDFIITPSMGWHEHGGGDEPMIWLDGLDLPLVSFLRAGFREDAAPGFSPPTRDRESERFSGLMAPLTKTPASSVSPVFNYPYLRSRETLHRLRHTEPDPSRGVALRYCNPIQGDWAMPTIGTSLHLLPKGFEGTALRSTDGMVYVVTEGQLEVVTGNYSLIANPKDVTAVPGWTWHRLRAASETVVFAFSDRAAQEKLGLWREERSVNQFV